jgi:2-iminobutanoate/2-iminopropanoate deaminase
MEKTHLMPPGHWKTPWPGPASQGWRVGNLVFVGGQISMDENGDVIGVGDFETQLRNVMDNIKAVMNQAGGELKDIFKMNAFVAYSGSDEEMWDFWEFQAKLRGSYFEAPGPAMTGIPVPRLGHPDLLIEIEALALLPEGT